MGGFESVRAQVQKKNVNFPSYRRRTRAQNGAMAWSAPRGVDDLVQKLANNRTASDSSSASHR